MGNFISNLFGLGNKDTRILMLGLDAAGKTTILYKLKLGEVVQSIPTIGFNVEEIHYKKLKLSVWDVGGQDRIRKLWKHYYNRSDALIYVVDSNDVERVEEAALELHKLMKEPELRDAPLLVYANKQDLPHAISIAQIVDKMSLHNTKRMWHVQATSAMSGSGLYEGLEWLSKAVHQKK